MADGVVGQPQHKLLHSLRREHSPLPPPNVGGEGGIVAKQDGLPSCGSELEEDR